jgi:hypothetical protein
MKLKNGLVSVVIKGAHMKLDDIEKISTNNLSLEDFERDYLNQKPVVIKDYITKWPSFNKWNLDFFEKNYPEQDVQVRYFEKDSVLFKKYIDTSMSKFMRYMREYDEFDEHLYLSGWEISKKQLPLCSDVEVPLYFKKDCLNYLVPELMNFYRMWVFIGHPKVQLSLHKDKFHSCSWLAMMQGHKHIRMFKEKSEVDINQSLFSEEGLKLHSSTNIVKETILGKGDLLYVPANWYHELKNIDVNIMLTGNFISKKNFQIFADSHLKNLKSNVMQNLLHQINS